jgi:DNA-binding protein YbaB
LFELEGIGKLIGDLGRIKETLQRLQINVKEGPVSLTFNGLQEVTRVQIGPEAEKEFHRLQAWFGTCFNKGVVASRQAAKEEIERLTGWSIPSIPGLI